MDKKNYTPSTTVPKNQSNLQAKLGPALDAKEVATIFSVQEKDVMRYYNDFGGVMITPEHCIFFENLILEKLEAMPTLDKRQKKIGNRWKGVVQVAGTRKEQRFTDDSQDSYEQAVDWENKMREILRQELGQAIKSLASGAIHTTTRQTACGVTLGQFAKTYLDDCKSRYVTKTYKEKSSCFRDLIKYFGDEMDIANITPIKANEFLQDTGKTRAGYATNKIKKNFNAGWTWASKFIEEMPKKGSPFKDVASLPEQRNDRYVPPKEHFDKVLNAIEGQDLAMMNTFYYTGARKSEVFKLKWDDVLFDKDCIRLWTKKRKGGNLEYDLIPMVTELKGVLLKWKERQKPKNESEHLFINELPQSKGYGKPFVDRSRFLRRACEDAGLKEHERFGYHGIRHLTATQLFHAGHSVSLIQQILRHKNPNTTAKYLHSLGLNKTLAAIDGTF